MVPGNHLLDETSAPKRGGHTAIESIFQCFATP